MSTSLLYQCFGITGRGIHHAHTRFEAGRTVILMRKTRQRRAYGFRDRAFFILRIYALHTTRYELVG